MDFTFTEEQQRIRDAARALAAKFDDHYWQEREERKEFPWEFYATFADAGWLGIAIPEEYGGGGLGITEAALVLHEIAASGAGLNGCSALHLTIFGINVVVQHGSPAQRAAILPQVVTGELHACFAITEADAGTDTTKITTFARREGDRYVVNGRKIWTTKAADAQKMLLLARTTPLAEVDRPTDGMSIFFTDVDHDAVEVRSIPKMGRNAVASNELFIDELEIPAEDLVGEEGEGFRYLLDGINPERILIAMEGIGLGRAALRRAVAYAKERNVFGRPIGQNQGIQFPLAEALARLDAAELVAWQAAWRYDQGLTCGREANTAKWLAAEAAFFAADRALQTHGGLGYANEYHVERYFREARLLGVVPVTQEMVLNYLGHNVLGLPKSY